MQTPEQIVDRVEDIAIEAERSLNGRDPSFVLTTMLVALLRLSVQQAREAIREKGL